jgi:PAS domain S-box-containing protein
MRDEDKTKEELLQELKNLRDRVAQVEDSLIQHERTEESLRRDGERLRCMVQQAGEGLFIHNLDGRMVEVNRRACDYLGYDRSELLELSITDIEKSVPVDKSRKIWTEMVPGTPVSFEGLVQGKDGSTFPADIRLSLIAFDGEHLIMALVRDMTDRKRLEAALKRVNEDLEGQVEERTKELNAKTRRLEEFNSALKVLLKQREEDKKELEESILMNVRNLILPYIEKLRRSRLSGDQNTWLVILESHLETITSPFAKRLSEKFLGLTPLEVQAANLIREGRTSKEIAESLCISENTVSSHRFHIRTKLGLRNKKINLRSYLKTIN